MISFYKPSFLIGLKFGHRKVAYILQGKPMRTNLLPLCQMCNFIIQNCKLKNSFIYLSHDFIPLRNLKTRDYFFSDMTNACSVLVQNKYTGSTKLPVIILRVHVIYFFKIVMVNRD